MGFNKEYFNIGFLDGLSYGETPAHGLDPRIKLIVSFVFILCVVSFPRYAVARLAPFFIYPVFLFAAGDIPVGPIMKKIVLISPFVVTVGIFNPILDREVLFNLMGIGVTGGWVSFISIIVKFVLTMSVVLLLIATTSFAGICGALSRLRFPDVFVMQLLFMYRYLFVLLEEAFRMAIAREARSFGRRGYEARTFVNLITVLLMRTFQRAENIHGAMISRGFSGEIRLVKKLKITFGDILFLIVFVVAFLFLRYYDLPTAVGDLVRKGAS